jgi:hypothetical protein
MGWLAIETQYISLMNDHQEEYKGRILHSRPLQEVETPFLNAELFAPAPATRTADLWTTYADESPSANADLKHITEEAIEEDRDFFPDNTAEEARLEYDALHRQGLKRH